MTHRFPFRRAACGALLLTLSCLVRAAGPSEISPDLYKQLSFRYIGPVGNRVSAVAGVPGNPLIYYAGSASGGIFKSADAGITWQPVFDDQPVSSIGSLAVDPTDPNVVWAGTGEPWIRSHISVGMGIYKSTDAGKTWKLMGLEKTGRIARIVIDPQHPETVFAAAMGHNYGPQQERGVFRTIDGGKSWSRVLFVDENTGCSDIVMSPDNPQVLFAGMWQFVIHTWGQNSGGPGSGLFMSRDGGNTWQRLNGSRTARNRRWAKSGWLFRGVTRNASTPSSKPARVSLGKDSPPPLVISGDPTTAAKTGE